MKVNQVKCRFLRRGETGVPVENQQTQPTYDAESGNRTPVTLVRGECSYHCAIPAPSLHPEPLRYLRLRRGIKSLLISESASDCPPQSGDETITASVYDNAGELQAIVARVKGAGSRQCNKPFPSSFLPPLQSKSRCEIFVMVITSTSHMNEN